VISNNGDAKYIHDVFYVPNIIILLVGIIANKGYLMVFGANKCWVLNAKQSSKVLAMGTKKHFKWFESYAIRASKVSCLGNGH
jgi:hypothetical protein